MLIDEYDKPILDNILDSMRGEFLSNSYIIKSEREIRFTFIASVSKFAHVSLFSDLNSLTDLTLQADYAEMHGGPRTRFTRILWIGFHWRCRRMV